MLKHYLTATIFIVVAVGSSIAHGVAVAAPPSYSNYMNAQFGNCGYKLCAGNGSWQCNDGNPADFANYGWQCIHPYGATSFTGTYTVKRAGIEVLLNIICDGVVVYAGKRLVGTSNLVVTWITPVVTSCYLTFGDGSNVAAAPNADFEVQFVFH